MSKRHWLIQGFDSSETIFEMKVELGQFTGEQIKHLLKALTSKAGLTYPEIIGAYDTRKTKIANNLLAVDTDSEFSTYSCGSNPHFRATVVDENDKIIRHRRLS